MVNVLWNGISNSGTIDVAGTVFPSAQQIGPLLTEKLSKTPQFRMLIRADKDVRYDFLRTLLKAAGEAGVNNVTFSVVDKEGSKTPPPLTP